MRRNVILTIAAIATVVTLGTMAQVTPRRTQAQERVQSASKKGRVVFDRAQGEARLVKYDGAIVSLGKGSFGQIDGDGNVLVGDWETGLHRYDGKTGQVVQLKGPHQVGVPFYLDTSGRYVAYQLFEDFEGEQYLTAGVGLLDLQTGRERVHYKRKHQYAHVVAWVGDRVLVLCWDDGPVDYPVFKLIDFNGREERLKALQQAPLAVGMPVASPDQDHLYYRGKKGIVLVNPASQTFHVYDGAESAYWTKDRLVVVTGGKEQTIDPYTVLP